MITGPDIICCCKQSCSALFRENYRQPGALVTRYVENGIRCTDVGIIVILETAQIGIQQRECVFLFLTFVYITCISRELLEDSRDDRFKWFVFQSGPAQQDYIILSEFYIGFGA